MEGSWSSLRICEWQHLVYKQPRWHGEIVIIIVIIIIIIIIINDKCVCVCGIIGDYDFLFGAFIYIFMRFHLS